MRALTIRQPWATAIALELKRVETRCWRTTYRGELAIHAAKDYNRTAQEFTETCMVEGRLPRWLTVPTGAIIAVGRLTRCYRVEVMRDRLTPEELAWGDYRDGRYGFVIEQVRVLPTPVECRGTLSMWYVPRGARAKQGDIEGAVRDQLRQALLKEA